MKEVNKAAWRIACALHGGRRHKGADADPRERAYVDARTILRGWVDEKAIGAEQLDAMDLAKFKHRLGRNFT